MATAPAVKAPNAWERFIDKVGAIFHKAAPVIGVIETAAVAAEPVLALTPFGPEYDVVVNAIVGAQKVGAASLAANSTLTGAQKATLAVEAATPALNSILASKGITSSTETVIEQFVQSIFGILAGPAVPAIAPAATTPAAPAA